MGQCIDGEFRLPDDFENLIVGALGELKLLHREFEEGGRKSAR